MLVGIIVMLAMIVLFLITAMLDALGALGEANRKLQELGYDPADEEREV